MKARTFNSDGAITGIYSVAKQSYDIGKYDQCIKLLQALNMNQGSELYKKVTNLLLEAKAEKNKESGLAEIVRSNPGCNLIN